MENKHFLPFIFGLAIFSHSLFANNCQKNLIVEPPIYQGLNGKFYVFLFPFVRTEVEFVGGEPYVTVYRGLREELNTTKSDGAFGDYIYTTLNPKVAISYLNRSIQWDFTNLTLVKLRLPLKKAYIAKRKKNRWGFVDYSEKDDYVPALANRNFIWLKWRAPARRRERELVWNLKELGGDLAPYLLEVITVPVEPNINGEYILNFSNATKEQKRVRDLWRAGQWSPLKK